MLLIHDDYQYCNKDISHDWHPLEVKAKLRTFGREVPDYPHQLCIHKNRTQLSEHLEVYANLIRIHHTDVYLSAEIELHRIQPRDHKTSTTVHHPQARDGGASP